MSYEAEVDAESADANTRSPSGLKLRPHTKTTGIFSGLAGENTNVFTKPRPMVPSAQQTQFRPPQSAPPSTTSAAEKALSLLPKFESSAARKQSQAAAHAQAAMTARAGSSSSHAAQAATQRPATNMVSQASYGTAASAEAYRHNAAPTGGASVDGPAAHDRQFSAPADARCPPESEHRSIIPAESELVSSKPE